jgi:hypothetical protein
MDVFQNESDIGHLDPEPDPYNWNADSDPATQINADPNGFKFGISNSASKDGRIFFLYCSLLTNLIHPFGSHIWRGPGKTTSFIPFLLRCEAQSLYIVYHLPTRTAYCTVKKVSFFPSPAGMSLTKLSLAGNNLITMLVSDIPRLRTGKAILFFYSVCCSYVATGRYVSVYQKMLWTGS